MEWHFNKRYIKILRCIKRHEGVTEGALIKKFDDDSISQLLVNLSIDRYAVAQNTEGDYFTYKQDERPWHCYPETRWYLTPKGDVVVEEHNRKFLYWFVPLTFSALALLISLINLAMKLFEAA